MKYERNGLLLTERVEPQLDEALDESLTSVLDSSKETYQYLTLTDARKTEITHSWHRGEDADLSFEGSDELDIADKLAKLQSWKAELLAQTAIDPTIKQLYRWKINEEIASLHLLESSAAGDMQNFHRWNEYIYGKPNEDTYRAALDWVAHDAEQLVSSEHALIAGVARRVLAMLDGKRGYRELLAPEPEVFKAVRDDHMRPMGYYGLALADVEMPEGKITTAVADPILKKVLQNIGSDKPIKDASGATWSVTSEAYLRPAKMNMVQKRFLGLGVGHEPSHEIERVNGMRGPVAIARRGLDRYGAGNEGRGVVREEVVFETFDEFGKQVRWRDVLRRDIAIGYACGIGEETPRRSSEVYEFINAIDFMYAAKAKSGDFESAQKVACDKTDALLLRVLKGTDGSGGAYMKDVMYLEGHVSNWLSAAIHGADRISQGDLGKFDISNDRHITALQEVGLLPRPE